MSRLTGASKETFFATWAKYLSARQIINLRKGFEGFSCEEKGIKQWRLYENWTLPGPYNKPYRQADVENMADYLLIAQDLKEVMAVPTRTRIFFIGRR